MKPQTKLKTALFLAAALNVSYASETCFPPKNDIPTLPEVLECFQSVQDAQRRKIEELVTITEKQQATISTQHWYYVGTRHCKSDTLVWKRGKLKDGYTVWKYSGKCGCCINQTDAGDTRWTFERSAIIWCK